MGASNMSIQTTAEKSYMDRPSMKEDDHPEHNMPAPEHDGIELDNKYSKMGHMGSPKLNPPYEPDYK